MMSSDYLVQNEFKAGLGVFVEHPSMLNDHGKIVHQQMMTNIKAGNYTCMEDAIFSSEAVITVKGLIRPPGQRFLYGYVIVYGERSAQKTATSPIRFEYTDASGRRFFQTVSDSIYQVEFLKPVA